MNTPRRARIEEVFHELAELPADQRDAALAEVARADPELRREVESLLAHDQAAAGSFPQPIAGQRSLVAMVGTPDGAAPRLGEYHILKTLGEGGFGVVYLALQREPIERHVAVKLLKPGMDSRQVLARFDAERQSLALMSHPCIAAVFDAGQSESGRPYFAMEYVAGLAITEYCDQRRLPIRKRLELFIKVCQGVQHAHEKGIVHRDLKPSNILVVENAEGPTPKIIDFGIAKALARDLPTQTVYTEDGQLMGTPEYMSPEQAEMTGQNIDTRTDVYALGVILYELVAGSTPLERHNLLRSGLGGIQRQILSIEPERPSARISKAGNAIASLAAARQTSPTALRRQLRGDLDWICLTALDKDKARRYGSPAELAADLERHLDDQPILARPPSTRYVVAKFVRRHRTLVVAAVLVLAALVAGLGGTTWQLLRFRDARDRALAAQVAAEAHERRADAERIRAEHNEESNQFQRYVASVRAAEAALQTGDGQLAMEHLDAAPEPFREWEWRLLHAWAHQDIRALKGSWAGGGPVAYSPDGALLAAGFGDGAVVVWSARTYEELRRWKAGGQSLHSLAFSPDSKLLASGSQDSSVSIWDASTGELVRTIKFHDFSAHWVEFSPDGSSLLTSEERSGRWALWNVADGAQLATKDEPFLRVAFDPSTGRIVMPKADGHIDLLSPSGTSRESLPIDVGTTRLFHMAISNDGSTLAGGLFDLRLVDLRSLAVTTLPFHHGPFDVAHLSFSRDGSRVIVSGSFGKLEVWDARAKCFIAALHGEPWFCNGARYSPDGTRIASAGDDGSIRIWDAVTRDETSLLPFDPSPPPNDNAGACLSPDGSLVVANSVPGALLFFDTRTLDPVAEIRTAAATPQMEFSPDGSRFAYDDGLGRLRIVDMTTGALVHSVSIKAVPERPRFSSDATHIAYCDRNDRITRIVRLDDGKEIAALTDRPDWSGAIAFSPDGTMLAVAAAGSRVRLLAWPSLDELGVLEFHTDVINDLLFTHDSRSLVSASNDGQIALWDAASRRLVRSMQREKPHKHSGAIGLAITPDDRRILCSCTNVGTQVFDLQRGELVLALRGNREWWPTLSMDAAGRFLATTEGRSSIRLWDSAPAADRTRFREAALAARAAARPLIDRLLAEENEPVRAAARLRGDAQLDPEVKREAQHLLLGRSCPPTRGGGHVAP